MRLAELLIENKEKEKTGVAPVDSMLNKIFDTDITSDPLPVTASESAWITLENPTRLVRTFQFNTLGKVRYFTNELLEYQVRKFHYCTMIITAHDITVETFTHDVDTVTQRDILLSKFCDEIFEDTKFVLNE